MNEIFSKKSFPLAPWWDRYEWNDAQTSFNIEDNWKYLIKIIASAKNWELNWSKDDDDLRIELDWYRFWKYEESPEKTSWKWYWTSSSWDWASLKWWSKAIYFFVELLKWKHVIKFFADNTPSIEEIVISKLTPWESFIFKDLVPSETIKTNKDGIPFVSFLFLWVKPTNFEIKSICKNWKQKGSTDSDNIKVITHKKLHQNVSASNLNKYKNFYFSWDIDKWLPNYLRIDPGGFDFIESSVEMWYDESPEVEVGFELFSDISEWEKGINTNIIKGYYDFFTDLSIDYFDRNNLIYSNKFLKHSLNTKPNDLIFDNNDEITKKIRKNKSYDKIISIVKKHLEIEPNEWQIQLWNELKWLDISFEDDKDLHYSLHWLKKIEYKVIGNTQWKYEVQITFFDIYDFDTMKYSLGEIFEIEKKYNWIKWYIFNKWVVLMNNGINDAEWIWIVKPFQIIITINTTID